MAKLSTDELLDAFKEMTLIELSEFVKAFEETFEVTAAAPVAAAAASADTSQPAKIRGQRAHQRVKPQNPRSFEGLQLLVWPSSTTGTTTSMP